MSIFDALATAQPDIGQGVSAPTVTPAPPAPTTGATEEAASSERRSPARHRRTSKRRYAARDMGGQI